MYFGDSAARAEEEWWKALEAREVAREEAEGIGRLFDVPSISRPSLKEVEDQALPIIVENIALLAQEHGQIKVGDYPDAVFGGYFGMVRETVVRAAIKKLHADGRNPKRGEKVARSPT